MNLSQPGIQKVIPCGSENLCRPKMRIPIAFRRLVPGHFVDVPFPEKTCRCLSLHRIILFLECHIYFLKRLTKNKDDYICYSYIRLRRDRQTNREWPQASPSHLLWAASTTKELKTFWTWSFYIYIYSSNGLESGGGKCQKSLFQQ